MELAGGVVVRALQTLAKSAHCVNFCFVHLGHAVREQVAMKLAR